MFKYSAIDLQMLQQIFDEEILPFSFEYELEGGNTLRVLFEQSQMSHLLGIQKVDHSRADLKGQRCYDAIKSGALTFSKLKSINRSAVDRECKDKMRYFDELPRLLANPECILFDGSLTRRPTRILMSFALRREDSSAQKRLILGIDCDVSAADSSYFPRTWLIERADGPSILDGQRALTVYSVAIRRRFS